MNISAIALSKYIVIFLAVFVAIFFLIILVRIILNYLLERSYSKYAAMKKMAKKVLPTSKKNFIKEDEVLKRDLEIPRAHSAVKAEKRQKTSLEGGSYELMPSNEQNQDLGTVEIVDFVKPVGFFTSMILGQKLTYLIQSAQQLNKRGNKGFWVSMIEAKDRAAGRQHGRGR